jgi:hypothetical protein
VTKDQDYAFTRPGLVAHKRRKLELTAGAPSRRGNFGAPGAGEVSVKNRTSSSLPISGNSRSRTSSSSVNTCVATPDPNPEIPRSGTYRAISA